MLVVLSDLHLTDGTAGKHNPPGDAFTDLFWTDLIGLARDRGADEVKLLLLGDVVDLVRTTQWFREDAADRPWGEHGLADVERPRPGSRTETRCLRILGRLPGGGGKADVPEDTILHQNWETLAFFRTLGERVRAELGRDLPVQIIYVPGNHDRLSNLYPQVRDAVRELFGIAVTPQTVAGDPDGAWWYRYDVLDERYGLYARHGHQYDPWNFGGGTDHTRRGHLQVPIGDVVACEFAVKLPHRLEAMSRDPHTPITPALAEKVQDMDLVRPLSSLAEWFYYRIRDEDRGRVREALDRAFDETVGELLALPFVQRWRSPDLYVDEAVRALGSRPLRWLPGALLDRLDAEDLLPLFVGRAASPKAPERDPLLRAAYDEEVWKANGRVHHVLYGHTHVPLVQPLDRREGQDVFYLNTGTWRPGVYRTAAFDHAMDFVKLRRMTYTAFYHADEDVRGKAPGTVSFDTWTGHRKKYRR